jgi:hypothetical protein
MITIKEILGTDSIFGSRITINENFKKVTNELNIVQSYLNTETTPGGAINIGSLLIKKYTRPVSTQLFQCEGSGSFAGDFSVGGAFTNTGVFTQVGNALFNSGFQLSNSVVGNNQFQNNIPTIVTKGHVNKQFDITSTLASGGLLVDPNTLLLPTNTSETRQITTASVADFLKVSVIRLNFSTFTNTGTTNCSNIILPAITSVTTGQIITVLIDNPMPLASYIPAPSIKIDALNLDPIYTLGVNLKGSIVSYNDVNLRKNSVTLYADTTGWRVLGSTGTVTY